MEHLPHPGPSRPKWWPEAPTPARVLATLAANVFDAIERQDSKVYAICCDQLLDELIDKGHLIGGRDEFYIEPQSIEHGILHICNSDDVPGWIGVNATTGKIEIY